MKLNRLLSAPTKTELIAAGTGITPPERARLRREHGNGRWRKMKGLARVELSDGWIGLAEVHWYEAHGIGRVDFKVKRRAEKGA